MQTRAGTEAIWEFIMNIQQSYLMFDGDEGSWNLWAIKFKGRAWNVGYAKLLEPDTKEPMLTDPNYDEFKEMNGK